jgi:hypothetical protein
MSNDRPPVEALLIPLADVPPILAISRAHLARLRAGAKFGPTVLKCGRKLLVRRAELGDWVNANMPDRRTWEAMQAQSRRYPRFVS